MIDLAFGIVLVAMGAVIGAMIQDEDYVTARHCAESMYNLGESE